MSKNELKPKSKTKPTDDFSDSFDKKFEKRSTIHIRVQQRNGKKCITTISGLPNDLDLKKIVKSIKKTYKTSGAVIYDEDEGYVLQIAGDKREDLKKFLTLTHIYEKDTDDLKIHGF